MPLTKVTVNVLHVPDVSTALVTDTTPGGLNAFLTTTYATIASPAFSGAPTSVTPANTSNNTQIATTAFVQSVVNANSYGKSTKAAGPKVWFSTAAPLAADGADDDIWLQYL